MYQPQEAKEGCTMGKAGAGNSKIPWKLKMES
jgi:hypothetical protein